MKPYDKGFLIFVLAVSLGFAGCAALGIESPDFQDGTWSNCTYTKDGKTKGPFPIQIPPGLQVPNVSEGVTVSCEPIPAAPEPDPTPV